MGVQYDGATQWHSGGFPSVQNSPIISCWFKPDALPGSAAMLVERVASGNVNRYTAIYIDNAGRLYAENSTTPGPVVGQAITANTATAGVWNHALGWFETGANRGAILNGGTEATNTAAVNPPAINELWIGAKKAGVDLFDGTIAHACLWDADSLVVDFTQMHAFATALYAGRPCHSYWVEYIEAYYPMHEPGLASVLRAWYTNSASTSPLTGTASPTQGEMPILQHPWPVSSHRNRTRPITQLVGRTQVVGLTQLASV